MSLWEERACARWHTALDHYTDVIQAQQVNGLVELDQWYRTEMPGLLAGRSPAYVTRTELERITVWKMKRGVWRERNRLLVLGNEPAYIKKTSGEAFRAIPDPRKPVDILSRLSGVGPATSSAVLACLAPSMYPFFDELVAKQIPDLGVVAFTASYYQHYAARLRERAEQLHRECSHREWTAHELSQALWAASGGKAAQEEPPK